jgi:cytidine deaminase
MMTNEQLIEKAMQARERAYAPYSKHRVGAVLVAEDGQLVSGANIENCVFNLGDCAERITLFKAVTDGLKQFTKMVIVTGNPELSPPCGACRQVLKEFCDDLDIIVSSPEKKFKSYRLKELFPHSFGPEALLKGTDA